MISFVQNRCFTALSDAILSLVVCTCDITKQDLYVRQECLHHMPTFFLLFAGKQRTNTIALWGAQF